MYNFIFNVITYHQAIIFNRKVRLFFNLFDFIIIFIIKLLDIINLSLACLLLT